MHTHRYDCLIIIACLPGMTNTCAHTYNTPISNPSRGVVYFLACVWHSHCTLLINELWLTCTRTNNTPKCACGTLGAHYS